MMMSWPTPRRHRIQPVSKGHHGHRQTHRDLSSFSRTAPSLSGAPARLRRAPIIDAYAAEQGRQLMATLAGVLDEVALHLIHLDDDEDAERGRGGALSGTALRPRPGPPRT